MIFSRPVRTAAAAAALLLGTASAQTYTSCNPTYQTCKPNTALGMAINVDFTQGAVNSFTSSGGTPTYNSQGVSFTVAKSGDSPQLNSVFYIMFGRVEVTMKAAPGQGMVSSLVLQSDDLDEIDFEWLGADPGNVQTIFFGKGQTSMAGRGQINPAANSQTQFITYVIDWTADRIVWSVGGNTVRTLQFAAANGQYPQTPMQVKLGAWSGGDSSNAPGTVQWAGGPTNYAAGPYSMIVKSMAVTDYSTGSQYKYSDTSGSWQSIQSVNGKINQNVGSAPAASQVSGSNQASSTLSPSVPAGGIASTTGTTSASSSIPSGWRMTSTGKIVPASSTLSPPSSSSTPSPSSVSSMPPVSRITTSTPATATVSTTRAMTSSPTTMSTARYSATATPSAAPYSNSTSAPITVSGAGVVQTFAGCAAAVVGVMATVFLL